MTLGDDAPAGPEAAARRYLAEAERVAADLPAAMADGIARPVRRAGVLGAGTMGGGIAMCFLNAGIPITLVEADAGALNRGVASIRRTYEASARKGRIDAAEVERRLALLAPTLDWAPLGEADLVVEAVFESLPLKLDLFARLDAVAGRDALLASNTSFLDLDAIAAATLRPERVLGLHFFSPANVMRLLEVVRGRRTGADAVATGMALARRLGKVAVLSGVGPGFIANRVMDARRREAERLLLEGVSPARIDRVLVDYGFPMGHFAMMDLVGLDVLGRDSEERTIMGDLVAAGRLGQKTRAGFFDYDDARNPSPSPVADGIVAAFARGSATAGEIGDDAIARRLLDAVRAEGEAVLREGVAARASDIDLACVHGYGWPAHLGGPMYVGDRA